MTKAKTEAKDVRSGLRGFVLKPESRVRATKPATSIRSRFYDLTRGMYFSVRDAAQEWGISEDTLRKHARDADCFRYVETAAETWEPCIMHPDTAKGYPVK